MTDWTIRDATPGDAAAIVALVHRVNREDGNPAIVTLRSPSASVLRNTGFRPPSTPAC